MDGGVKADAVWALDKMAAIGAVVSGTAGQCTVGTDGVGDEGGRAEEEVEGEGGAVILRGVETEPVGDGDALQPRAGALANRAIKQAATALRGGCGVMHDQEISRGEGSTGGRCGMW